MLYTIYQFFDINLLHYITVRSGFAFFIAFLVTLFLLPKFIRWAKNRNANQPIYHLAPENHQIKSSTPTMGGVVFILSAIVAILLTAKLNNIYVILGLITIISFSFIGIKDDLSKVVGKKNEAGLTARKKMIYQIFFASIISIAIYFLSKVGSNLYIPMYKKPLSDISYFAIPFWVLVIIATSNAVNLTDGLDGLATVPSMFAIGTLGIFIYLSGHADFSRYLFLPKVSGVGEVAILGSALIGSLLGFLWYNCHPAEVFMGDSGSLSIGAFIAYMGIISKNEILLFLVGFVFVLEALSVILQVGSYKTRKKRIFYMAPIHHHFEIKGWAENKIIVRFWMIALLSNLIALITLKIR